MYKVSFVVNISELGEDDPLTQNVRSLVSFSPFSSSFFVSFGTQNIQLWQLVHFLVLLIGFHTTQMPCYWKNYILLKVSMRLNKYIISRNKYGFVSDTRFNYLRKKRKKLKWFLCSLIHVHCVEHLATTLHISFAGKQALPIAECSLVYHTLAIGICLGTFVLLANVFSCYILNSIR